MSELNKDAVFSPLRHEPHLFTEIELDAVLRAAAEYGSSDILFIPGYPVRIEKWGKLFDATRRALTPEDVSSIITHIRGIEAMPLIQSGLSISTSYEIPDKEDGAIVEGAYRFRVECSGQERLGVTAGRIVLRFLPAGVPSLSTQHPSISNELMDAMTPGRGMVLVVGATGTGKSTLLAGALRRIGETHPWFIMTFEEPIEFVYRPDLLKKEGPWQATISQSEIGRHFVDTKQGSGWHNALRSALRSAPKALLIGEMRDKYSIKSAVEFVRTGHLLYSTMHVDGVAAIPSEIMSRSEGDHGMVSRVLSVLRCAVYQRLAMRKDGQGRCAIREYLIFDKDVRARLQGLEGSDAEKEMQRMMRERGTDIASEAKRMVRDGWITQEEGERVIKEAY